MDFPTLNVNKIALFDMDGTLVDFQKALAIKLKLMLGPDEVMPPNLWDMPDYMYERAQAIKREPGFWKSLPPIQWGWDVMKICREIGYDIHLLTKGPTTGARAWSEKVEWRDKYLPGTPLHIVEDKRIVYGRVFVDDYAPFIEAWLKHRPRGVAVTNNEELRDSNVINYSDGLQLVRERLEKAFHA